MAPDERAHAAHGRPGAPGRAPPFRHGRGRFAIGRPWPGRRWTASAVNAYAAGRCPVSRVTNAQAAIRKGAVRTLWARGLSISAIAKGAGCDWRTAKRDIVA